MLFRDIVRACFFKNVKESLLRLYPEQKKNINGYKDVFKTLCLMRPRYNKEGMVIDIRRVGRGKNANFAVSGICEGQSLHFGICPLTLNTSTAPLQALSVRSSSGNYILFSFLSR